MKTKRKIGVIDDNPGFVDMLKDFLEIRDFEVSCAFGGLEGFEMVKREKPEIVLLDITMPDMDGRDVILRLKKDDTLKGIHIIVLTARDDAQFDREYVIKLGAYEYINKPYDNSFLLRQINNILAKKDRGEL